MLDRISMISIKNLIKSYAEHGRVVDGISFEVPEGECLVLVGPSGCGKSTTLKMINGLISPDSGSIEVARERLPAPDQNKLRRKIGYVIQQAGLFPHLTVFQNISLVARLGGWSQGKIRERVEELLQMMNLDSGKYVGKYPLELSGGEQQRVGLARALMLDPPILLMDEPFGALDPIRRRQLQTDFLGLQAKMHSKKTILFVTHDMNEALLMGNRIAIMDGGRIIQSGAPDEIQNKPATKFVADFFQQAIP